MAGRPFLPLPLSSSEHRWLSHFAATESKRKAEHAQIILLRAEGLNVDQIAQKLSCSSRRVNRWLARFRQSGIDCLQSPSSPAPPEKTSSTSPHPSTSAKSIKGVGMSLIAQKANVSMMTVSRVLNNRPHVRPELRKQILNIANELGYAPDPQVSKLMVHLRKQRANPFQGTICSLESKDWNPEHDHYFRPLVRGAQKQAEALGFIWQSFSLEEFLENPSYFSRLWYHRGVEGVFLPPASHHTRNQSIPLDEYWDRFSVVAATYSIPNLNFHRVVPNHFKNMHLICENLTQRGYDRIGLVMSQNLDNRVFHHFSGSFAGFHLARSKTIIPPFFQDISQALPQLKQWFDREKPNALIVSSGHAAQIVSQYLQLKPSDNIAIAAAAIPGDTAGIDELPAEVGAKAIELIGNMVIHRKTGLSNRPTVWMVEGLWKDPLPKSQNIPSMP